MTDYQFEIIRALLFGILKNGCTMNGSTGSKIMELCLKSITEINNKYDEERAKALEQIQILSTSYGGTGENK